MADIDARMQKSFDRGMKKLTKKVAEYKKQLARDALLMVQDASPVDTGRFRGNWKVGINAINPIAQWGKYDPNTMKTYCVGCNKINKSHLADHIFISNNIEYASELEHGKSWRQAPVGILCPTVSNLNVGIRRLGYTNMKQ